MSKRLTAMQSMVDICEYHRPYTLLRSNTEFLVMGVAGEGERHLLIGIGPKSAGDEVAAPPDLAAVHVMVGTRIGAGGPDGAGTYLLERFMPPDLRMPIFFRTGQFFPADGLAELSFRDARPVLSVRGRHAHMRDDEGNIIEVQMRGMRSRLHIEGPVEDLRAALAWHFTATPLPWRPQVTKRALLT